MKHKIIWSIVLIDLIIAYASARFYNVYQQRIAANEARICAETGTQLPEQELRIRVIENFLWQMLKETFGGNYLLRRRNIAVVKRHISKDEIISLIENSSARQFLHDIENNQETVIFTRMDLDKNSLGFFADFFASDEYKIRKQQALINKMTKAKDMFSGPFSLIAYDNSYERVEDGHEYRQMSVTSSDTLFLNNGGFRKNYDNFSISGSNVNYSSICNKIPTKIMTYKRANVSSVEPYDHAYGRFFYQYISYHPIGIGYNGLYSHISNKEERKKKIRARKDESIYLINRSYSLPKFLVVSNCGDILEYYRESGGSGYEIVNRF